MQVGGGTSGLTSSSDDDGEFSSIAFPPDDAIQKVNVNDWLFILHSDVYFLVDI